MKQTASHWPRLAGAACLDALNTVGGPLGDRAENDLFASPAALAEWSIDAAVLPPADLAALKRGLELDGARALSRFRRFREAAFEVIDAAVNARDASPEALDALARTIAAAKQAASLDQKGGWPRWRLRPVEADSDRLTAALALEMDAFMAGADLGRVRRCRRCSWVFLAPLRGRPRIWCSMALCGNRDKQARHTARTRLVG